MTDIIYAGIEDFFQNMYVKLHAVYGPEENGWYCAAVDLFDPGMTFRIYFTLKEENQVVVEEVQRWFIG